MILMPQIFDVTANENARYKRNELEYLFPKSASPPPSQNQMVVSLSPASKSRYSWNIAKAT